MTRFVHPIWLEEAIYRRANIDIEPGNGFTSPMPLLTGEQRARVAEARWIEETLRDPGSIYYFGSDYGSDVG